MPKMHLSRNFARKTRRALRPKRLSHPSLRHSLAAFLESPPVVSFLLVATLYLLFAHDIIAASGAAWTRGLSASIGAIDMFVALVFLAELVANVVAYKRKYLFSWYSILDLIALLSLIPDIMQFLFLVDVNSDLNQFRLARVARTARLATRMARLPKLINLLHCGKKKKEVEEVEPSAIAEQLQNKISAKVIVAVLLITLVATLCNQPLDLTSHAKLALNQLQAVAISTNFSGPLYQQILDLYLAQFNVLQLRVAGNSIVNQERTISRTQTIYLYKVDTDLSNSIISEKQEHQEIYGLSIVQTACTIIILFLACLLISHDMLSLVIRPIERMLGLIKKLTTTISNHSTTNTQCDSYSDSDSDSDEEGEFGASDVESATTDMDDDERETNLLVEFVKIVSQQQVALEQHRKEEHAKKKMVAVLDAGIHGWLARKKYKKITKMYFSRAQVAKELATTEKSFISSLLALRNVFIVPLREADILDADTLQSMFLGVEAVFNYSKSLMTKLDSRMQSWNIHSTLDDLFDPLDELVDAYSEFINNYNHASEAILKQKETNPKFLEFVKEQERHPACNAQPIESFMIMPVQRPPRYVMLMETFAKYTPEDHPDYSIAINAANNLKKATTLINERKRESENRALIQSIYIRLEPAVDLLMNNTCVFLKEGTLKHEGDSFQFYLFTNVLLKCQKQGGTRLQVVQEIPVTCFTRVIKIADSPHYDLLNAFQIDTTVGDVLLIASSNAIQTEWMDTITQCLPKPKDMRRKSVVDPANINLNLLPAGAPSPSSSPRTSTSAQNSPRRKSKKLSFLMYK